MGRPKRIFSEQETKDILHRYVDLLESKRSIAKSYQISVGCIDRLLRENDVEIRGVAQANGTEVPEENARIVINNYVEKGQGLQTAGRQFGYSQKVVETILKHYGVHKRTYVESKQIQRKYSCNDNFFKYQNENMAYVLGFLAADGSIAKKENGIFINLHQQDAEILERIKEVTENSRPISYYTKNGTKQELCKFSVWSYQWKQDLAKYGVVPEKTFTLKPPLLLDSKYFKDYIRGYFDGDGSVYPRRNKKIPDKPSIKIAGASKEMMDWLYDVLTNQYHIYTPGYYPQKCSDTDTIMYNYCIYKYEEVTKFYNLLYGDNPDLFLQRKKQKFDSLI